MKYWEGANIESRPLWKPMHLQPVFSEYPYGNAIAETLFTNGLFTIWFQSYGRGSK
jgi:hypothetical protein